LRTKVFLTQRELSDRWSVSPRTLEGWRDKGIGIAWTKIGSRVRYHVDDIEDCERRWRSKGELS
jgi:hypothetical protein